MKKEEKEKLKKKLKIYELLGAVKFQKVVFKVEELKFKIIKKIFPNFISYYDKYCDFRKKRMIKRAKTEDEIKDIQRRIKFSKMAMRKEINFERNRNYHIDEKRPTEIIKYLEWNKSIHKGGLIKDGILIPFIIAGCVLGIPGSIPLLVFEVLSVGINFECINIQNYNLCRIRQIEPALRKREERQIAHEIEEYGDAAKAIHECVEAKEQLPSLSEIIDSMTTPEQLEQFKKLIREEIQRRENAKKGGYQI